MKIYIIALFLFCSYSWAQVGIGSKNPDPSSILDINSTTAGLLIPRLTETEKSSIHNPANGLIIYNTDKNFIEFNRGTPGAPIWFTSPTTTTHRSVKYSNTSTSNLPDDTDIPIFETLEWNDDAGIFNRLSNTEIEVLKSGRYAITANLSLQRAMNSISQMHIKVNGARRGSYAFVSNISARGIVSNDSSLSIIEVFELNANDTISLNLNSSSNSIAFRNAGSSNISILKIR